MSVANSVNGHSSTLSSALLSAFTPAITQTCGTGDMPKMRRMAFRASKFGALLILLFVVPLVVELPAVLCLWLKTPPAWTTTLCVGVIAALLAEKSTYGHMIAMNALGKVAAYQAVVGTTLILTFPVAFVFVKCGLGVPGIALALITTACAASIGRVFFARRIVGMGVRKWICNLVVPVVISSILSGLAGYTARFVLEPCLMRILLTVLLCEAVFLPLSWFIVLDMEERYFAKKSLHAFVSRLGMVGRQ
jgi:hypothetical protein